MDEKVSGDTLSALRSKFRKASTARETDRATHKDSSTPKLDRRTLRRTGRTNQLAVRVTAATRTEYHAYAQAHGILLAEVLERALAALKAQDERDGW